MYTESDLDSPPRDLQRARRLISYCKQEGRKILHLDMHGLTSLPDELFELTQLKGLSLGYNRLNELPEDFGKLTALEWLDLSCNNLADLPESFGELRQLKTLNLAGNPFTTERLHAERLRATGSKGRSLDHNQRTDRTADVSGAESNHFTEVPECIGRLTALECINLAYNQLTDLPEYMGELPELKYIDLSGNNLTDQPERIGDMQLNKNMLLNIESIQYGGTLLYATRFSKRYCDASLTPVTCRGRCLPF